MTFPISDLINAIIAFIAVAIVVYFVFVHPMNVLKERAAAKAGLTEADEEPKLPTEQEILVQIRDLLEKQGALEVLVVRGTSRRRRSSFGPDEPGAASGAAAAASVSSPGTGSALVPGAGVSFARREPLTRSMR